MVRNFVLMTLCQWRQWKMVVTTLLHQGWAASSGKVLVLNEVVLQPAQEVLALGHKWHGIKKKKKCLWHSSTNFLPCMLFLPWVMDFIQHFCSFHLTLYCNRLCKISYLYEFKFNSLLQKCDNRWLFHLFLLWNHLICNDNEKKNFLDMVIYQLFFHI